MSATVSVLRGKTFYIRQRQSSPPWTLAGSGRAESSRMTWSSTLTHHDRSVEHLALCSMNRPGAFCRRLGSLFSTAVLVSVFLPQGGCLCAAARVVKLLEDAFCPAVPFPLHSTCRRCARALSFWLFLVGGWGWQASLHLRLIKGWFLQVSLVSFLVSGRSGDEQLFVAARCYASSLAGEPGRFLVY